ncbi:MAG: hypothetical protein AAGA48_09090 [Myxococcota bacterium]
MGFFDKIRRTLAENETLQAVVKPVRDLEAKASGAVEATARKAMTSARDLAENFIEPEVLDDLEARARRTNAALAKQEEAFAERVADAVQRQTGLNVDAGDVLHVGRAVVASVVVAGVAEAVVDTGSAPVELGGTESFSPSAEGTAAPTILYDGMGNMDGTSTITDGGVSIDTEGL